MLLVAIIVGAALMRMPQLAATADERPIKPRLSRAVDGQAKTGMDAIAQLQRIGKATLAFH
jgi:hypothetical protein